MDYPYRYFQIYYNIFGIDSKIIVRFLENPMNPFRVRPYMGFNNCFANKSKILRTCSLLSLASRARASRIVVRGFVRLRFKSYCHKM